MSKYVECTGCKKTQYKIIGKGLCSSCYQKNKFANNPIAECSVCKKTKKLKIINPPKCSFCSAKNSKNYTTHHKSSSKKYRESVEGLFNYAKRLAKERKIEWKIKLDEFISLRSRPCFYCGGSLPRAGHGIDRINNDKKVGYSIENALPCCLSCNSIRGDKLSVSEMISAMHAVKEQRAAAIETLYECGYHIDTRTLFVFNEINETLASNIIKGVDMMEEINPHAPIHVKVMSEGGNWHDGLAIYDKLRNSPCPIYMLGTGMVASTATAIMQAGDKREITENCSFLLHDGEDGFEGEAKSFEAWAESSKKNRKKLYEIYAEKTGKPTSVWQTLCLKDTILTSDKIIDYGLADNIKKSTKELK